MNDQRRPRPVGVRVGLILAALLFFAVFMALGTWQLERRTWKLDLLARIQERVHAAPVPAPEPAQWPGINAAADEYRPIRASGIFLHDHETLVQAVTDLGAGYWVLTPLKGADGSVILVNRGFVPPERRNAASRAAANPPGDVTVTGLLRVTEPGGTLLRRNEPSMDHWYSRDVAAIAASRQLRQVAPYFIDAAPGAGNGGAAAEGPIGGLTVLNFSNNHLSYALTWFALALLTAGGAVVALRSDQRPPSIESRIWR
jgi:surfeit locus 1 family protein